jgi:NADH-quinone oxidoreductase subunit K
MTLQINLSFILKLTSFLFCVGTFGLVLNRKNILVALMCIELLLLVVNFNFIIFSLYLDDLFGSLFILFILTVAASESALGLAILTVYYKLKSSILLKPLKNTKLKV